MTNILLLISNLILLFCKWSILRKMQFYWKKSFMRFWIRRDFKPVLFFLKIKKNYNRQIYKFDFLFVFFSKFFASNFIIFLIWFEDDTFSHNWDTCCRILIERNLDPNHYHLDVSPTADVRLWVEDIDVLTGYLWSLYTTWNFTIWWYDHSHSNQVTTR